MTSSHAQATTSRAAASACIHASAQQPSRPKQFAAAPWAVTPVGGTMEMQLGRAASMLSVPAAHQTAAAAFATHAQALGGGSAHAASSSSLAAAAAATAALAPAHPASPDDPPMYVNPKQYKRILARRIARARFEERCRTDLQRGYLYESRHAHAVRRPRDKSGRFLTQQELNAMPNEGPSVR